MKERKKSVEVSSPAYVGSALEDMTILLGMYDSRYIKSSDWGY